MACMEVGSFDRGGNRNLLRSRAAAADAAFEAPPGVRLATAASFPATIMLSASRWILTRPVNWCGRVCVANVPRLEKLDCCPNEALFLFVEGDIPRYLPGPRSSAASPSVGGKRAERSNGSPALRHARRPFAPRKAFEVRIGVVAAAAPKVL
jgi:hypothetical protein